jgi:hypothetical protein
MISDKIILVINQNESQFQLARRAFILIAQQSGLPPSEQIAFADFFVPLSLNNPSFQLSWTGKSDPSPRDSSNVKVSEFNLVKRQQVTITLTSQQKEYLIKKREELLRSGNLSLSVFSSENSLYGFSGQSGSNLWESYVNSGVAKGSREIKNVEISEELRAAIRILESEALNFSTRFINDARVRQDYLRQTKEVAEEILATFMYGEVTEKQAATTAHNLRNGILDASRLKTSDIGLALAQAKKLVPEPLSFYEEKYAKNFFKKTFSELDTAQRNRVWLEIVKSSARPNAPITAKTIRLNRLGKGLLVVSIGISVYNIATSDDKVRTTAKEGTTLLGGIAGGAAGGAVAGLACGPGAPVCVTLGVFIGGIIGAMASDYAFDAAW